MPQRRGEPQGSGKEAFLFQENNQKKGTKTPLDGALKKGARRLVPNKK